MRSPGKGPGPALAPRAQSYSPRAGPPRRFSLCPGAPLAGAGQPGSPAVGLPFGSRRPPPAIPGGPHCRLLPPAPLPPPPSARRPAGSLLGGARDGRTRLRTWPGACAASRGAASGCSWVSRAGVPATPGPARDGAAGGASLRGRGGFGGVAGSGGAGASPPTPAPRELSAQEETAAARPPFPHLCSRLCPAGAAVSGFRNQTTGHLPRNLVKTENLTVTGSSC